MVNRKLIIWLTIPILIASVILGFRLAAKHKYEQARKMWKDAALATLAGTSMTNEKIFLEINQIKHSTPDLNFGWTNEHVLLMTNGEYLVYAFYHGFNSGFIDHLFLAHGSDGRWYYSTYHFCNHMAAVTGDEPPGSIAAFTVRYAVREFDGKSDICLQHTWP